MGYANSSSSHAIDFSMVDMYRMREPNIIA
jgi:hypothetical protein